MIVGFVESLQPRSVLDVGTGMGQYGLLLRNSLESVNLFEIEGNTGRQRPREGWNVVIDGIEGFPGYITPVHTYAYSAMRIGEARSVLAELPSASYDVVLAIDILEHFEAAEGRQFAADCIRVAKHAVLVSTPKEFIEQVVDANPLENHRSMWSRAQLEEMGLTTILPNHESWIAVWSP